jgi:nitrite reductase/ring-hydroxylating ferredoxin subunit
VQAVGVEKKRFAGGPQEWTRCWTRPTWPRARRGWSGPATPRCCCTGGQPAHALWASCTHECGPLAEGTFADGCVTCPWHGSTFRLADGKVVRGPAAASQPVYETRVTDGGRIEVRTAP